MGPCPQSTQEKDPPGGVAVPCGASDHMLLLVPQMSWANLRATFPALSPAQLHRLLTQYQLAAGMGPMSAWEPGARDSPDAFKSGKPPQGREQGPCRPCWGQWGASRGTS